MLEQFSTRQTECDNRLTEVRNEYLLTLAAVNTHHQHYYTSDLPHIMEVKHAHTHTHTHTHTQICCYSLGPCLFASISEDNSHKLTATYSFSGVSTIMFWVFFLHFIPTHDFYQAVFMGTILSYITKPR